MVENTEPIQKPAISSGSGLMSVKKMGSQLGLKKTESYRLIHMGFFETIELFGKTWIDRDSFEAWYANQVHYVKTEGEAPGKRLTEKSYSVKEISGLLGISEGSVYDLIKKNCFETIQTNGQRRIDKDDFDRWYANQTRYQAVTDKEKYTQAAPRQEALDKEGAGTDGGCCDTTCMVDKTTFNVPSGSEEIPEYYTVLQASKIAGVSKITISVWISGEKFPSVRIGKSVYIQSKGFHEFILTRG